MHLIEFNEDLYGEERFVCEEECKELLQISRTKREKMIVTGHFPAQQEDENGQYGWLATDLADYVRITSFAIIMNLFPDRYPPGVFDGQDTPDGRENFH